MKIKLVIFSDPHYGTDVSSGLWKGVQRKLVQYSEDTLEKMICTINKIKPDAAICLGDLIQDEADYNIDLKNLKYAVNMMRKIKVPYFLIPGNHDLRTLSLEDVRKVFGYGSLTYSRDIAGGGLHLVMLSPEVSGNSMEQGGIQRTRNVSRADLDWLRADLANNNLPAIICFHYGIGEDEMDGNWWFEGNKEAALIANRAEIREIIEKDPNVLAVFSGHQHWTKSFTENGVDYYLLGSLTENINDDGKPDGVWYEVDIDDGKINVQEHHLIYDPKLESISKQG